VLCGQDKVGIFAAMDGGYGDSAGRLWSGGPTRADHHPAAPKRGASSGCSLHRHRYAYDDANTDEYPHICSGHIHAHSYSGTD